MDINKMNYKSEMDSLCENNLKLTAEDILNSSATVTDLTGATSKMKNTKKIVTLIAASVCTIGAVGVIAGATGHGPLSTLFAKKAAVETENAKLTHDDLISSYLAEQGYLLDINETQTAEGFEVTLEGVTGDWTNAQMLVTIRTDDEEFIKEHDKFDVAVYKGFDEETFANRYNPINNPDGPDVGTVGFDMVTAYQSAEDPSVYILTYGAYPYYVHEGATIVTQIMGIQIGIELIPLDCTFKYTLPNDSNALADDHHFTYEFDEAMTFVDNNGVEYHVSEVILSKYETQFFCEFYYDGTALEYIDEDFWANIEEASEEFQATAGDIRLVVDGVEYAPTELGYVYGDPSGLRRSYASFSEVDFDNASSIKFTYNGTEMVIK